MVWLVVIAPVPTCSAADNRVREGFVARRLAGVGHGVVQVEQEKNKGSGRSPAALMTRHRAPQTLDLEAGETITAERTERGLVREGAPVN